MSPNETKAVVLALALQGVAARAVNMEVRISMKWRGWMRFEEAKKARELFPQYKVDSNSGDFRKGVVIS